MIPVAKSRWMACPFRESVSVKTRRFQPGCISFDAGENSVKIAWSARGGAVCAATVRAADAQASTATPPSRSSRRRTVAWVISKGSLLAGDDAAGDAVPLDRAGEPAVLDLGAAVHH